MSAATNIIEIYEFTSSDISAGTMISFNVDSIRNPSIEGGTDAWVVEIIDDVGSTVDTGTWYLDDDYWGPGNITTFTVTPGSEGVGQFPVEYTFHFIPVGEICQNCYFAIDIPPEIAIVDEDALENSCGTNLENFIEEEISCYLSADGTILYIDGGFESAPTTNLTDNDYYDDPPEVYFTIDYFRNPREPVATTPWNITVYNSSDDIQYSWNETSPTRPTTLIYGTAEPGYLEISRDSE